jgi:IclR family transcriptional regulator, acetate operon repressor
MTRKHLHVTPSVQSLDRGLSILEAVGQSSDPVGLKQLTTLLGIDRSNVFRLANTLRQRRFLAHAEGSREYVLGPSAWRLARRYLRSRLIAVCHDHVCALAEKTGETAHLGVREGSQVLFLDHHVAEGQMVTVAGQTGQYLPLYNTAHGKALLADCDRAELTAIFAGGPLRAATRRTIVSLDRLAGVCARIRAQGIAIDDRESLDEIRCVAAPVRDQEGHIVASVGISAPTSRFPTKRFAIAARQVSETAKAIASALAR